MIEKMMPRLNLSCFAEIMPLPPEIDASVLRPMAPLKVIVSVKKTALKWIERFCNNGFIKEGLVLNDKFHCLCVRF